VLGKFLGTGDAQGIPGAFCRCAVCEEARNLGGPSIRQRSSFRLSDRVLIDLGADAVSQSLKYGSFSDVEHILITHTHEDHLNVHMIMEMVWGRRYLKSPIHFYLTDMAFDIIEHWRQEKWIIKGSVPKWEAEGLVVFHKLEFGERIKIDDFYVTPMRGNHKGNVGEDAALYFIELPDGKNLFYGLDSGVYYKDTIDELKNKHIDYFISEATMGISPTPHIQHMRLCDVYDLVNLLLNQGTLNSNSVIYLSHINHSSSHSQMLDAVEKIQFPLKTIVAYDGMKILE
jgi:phosphoribosyl 1,2-cyclic phosphate phosphodiesterase